ncbi:MAG: hypothetical protein IMW93_06840 [Thermoanaerobacteraceae bacterium]|nr:hypothetical protein [Thermoanaerobacteraceae bacterium]
MAGEEIKGHHLEQVLFSLLDYQSSQDADNSDTMLMLGLLNLLGIVSLMNKQAGTGGVSQAGAGGMNPMLQTLLQMMMSGGGQPPAGQGAPGEGTGSGFPMNPALLLSLMNQKPGQGPDPALLLTLLGSMMGPRPSGPPPRPPAPPPGKQEVPVVPVPMRPGGEQKQAPIPRPATKWGARLEGEKKG